MQGKGGARVGRSREGKARGSVQGIAREGKGVIDKVSQGRARQGMGKGRKANAKQGTGKEKQGNAMERKQEGQGKGGARWRQGKARRGKSEGRRKERQGEGRQGQAREWHRRDK